MTIYAFVWIQYRNVMDRRTDRQKERIGENVALCMHSMLTRDKISVCDFEILWIKASRARASQRGSVTIEARPGWWGGWLVKFSRVHPHETQLSIRTGSIKMRTGLHANGPRRSWERCVLRPWRLLCAHCRLKTTEIDMSSEHRYLTR